MHNYMNQSKLLGHMRTRLDIAIVVKTQKPLI